MNVIELIQTIERRPGMFFPQGSLEALAQFVRGFVYCRTVEGVLDEQDRSFGEFYPYLVTKHGLESDATWSDLVMQLASRSGADPVPTFFAEFKQFLSERTAGPS